MKLKELINKYGEYEVSETKGDWGDVTLELNKPKPKTVWELKEGDSIVIISCDGSIENYKWYDCFDDERDNSNVFLTYEDAVTERERRQVETLLLKHGGRRGFDEHNFNYHIGLDDLEEHLKVYILATVTQGTIYFDTKAQAEKAISEIGEERIKKALFKRK